MFYLTMFEKQIISASMIIVFIILSYIFIKWFLKNRRKMIKTEMLTLNMVIKFKKFLSYLNYQNKQDEKYILYLVSIDNLDLLERTYDHQTVRTYLRRVAKNLSVYLPYGGKLAQTEKRDTFILYIPESNITEESYAESLKQAASEIFYKDHVSIIKNINITYLKTVSKDYFKDLNSLTKGLIQSTRNLGEVIMSEESTPVITSEYQHVTQSLTQSAVNIMGYDVTRLILDEKSEFYPEVYIDRVPMGEYLEKISISDQAWVNMWGVEALLQQLQTQKVKTKITLPILCLTLEKEGFIERLETLMYNYQYLPEQTIISIKESHISNQQEMIKNLFELKTLGYQISYQIKDITPNLYIDIQAYHVSRIEIEADLLLTQTEMIHELLYFAKVNQIETLVKSNQTDQIETFKNLNVTHLAEKNNQSFTLEKNKKSRGRK